MVFPKFMKIAVASNYGYKKINDTYSVREIKLSSRDEKYVQLLAKALGFAYKLYSPSDREIGRALPDGNWTGLIGMVQRNEVDLAVSNLGLSEQSANVVSFTYPFNAFEMTFATRKPEYTPDVMAYIKPFALDVWIAMFLVFALLPLVLLFVFQNRSNYLNLAFCLTEIFMGQSLMIIPRIFREYLLLGFCMVNMMLLSNFYKAVLLSFLTFPPLTGVRTISELSTAVLEGRYQCVTRPGSFMITELSSSTDSILRVIGEDLARNSIVGSYGIDDVLDRKESVKKTAYITTSGILQQYEHKYFKSNDIFYTGMLAFAVRKDFCCKAAIDRAILYANAGGLFKKILDDARKSMSKKSDVDYGYSKESSERQLSLYEFEGAFIIIIIGYSLSLLVLILEIIINCLKNRSFNKSTV